MGRKKDKDELWKDELSEEKRKKVEKIEKYASSYIDILEDGRFDVAGAVQITDEEAENEEMIKEKLREMGYLKEEGEE